MIPEINYEKGNYELDFFCFRNGDKFPALTQRNSDFIEAIIRLDSNYAKDFDPKCVPSKDFNPEEHWQNANGKYCGSTAYWFDQLNDAQTKDDFKKCIYGIVTAIDSANSTHLGACKDGRKTVAEMIIARCNSKDALKNKLNEDFTEDPNHILALLTKPIQKVNSKGTRYNLSFASKFCSYAAMYLKTKKQYSRYDGIVSDALPVYVKKYLGEDLKKGEFKIEQNEKTSNTNDSDELKKRLSIYKKYSDALGEIEKEVPLNRDQIDHIIWYTLKGRKFDYKKGQALMPEI